MATLSRRLVRARAEEQLAESSLAVTSAGAELRRESWELTAQLSSTTWATRRSDEILSSPALSTSANSSASAIVGERISRVAALPRRDRRRRHENWTGRLPGRAPGETSRGPDHPSVQYTWR
jgi:hypothetical protein